MRCFLRWRIRTLQLSTCLMYAFPGKLYDILNTINIEAVQKARRNS